MNYNIIETSRIKSQKIKLKQVAKQIKAALSLNLNLIEAFNRFQYFLFAITTN